MLYVVTLCEKIHSGVKISGRWCGDLKKIWQPWHIPTLSGTETMGVKEDGVKEEEAVDLGRVMLGGALRSSIRYSKFIYVEGL